MAWNEASASCSSREGVARPLSFFPIAPRKSPITAMSGLKTFDEAGPYTGSGPEGPPAPAAPGGTSVGGGAAGGSGDGDGSGGGGFWASGTGDGAGSLDWAHNAGERQRETASTAIWTSRDRMKTPFSEDGSVSGRPRPRTGGRVGRTYAGGDRPAMARRGATVR